MVLQLRVQIREGRFEHRAMLRVRRDFKLLLDVLPGKLQASSPLLLRDLFGRELLT